MLLSGLIKAPPEAWVMISQAAKTYTPGDDCASLLDWDAVVQMTIQGPSESLSDDWLKLPQQEKTIYDFTPIPG